MKTIASVFGFLLAGTAIAAAAPFPMTSTTPPTGEAYSYKAEGSGGNGPEVIYNVPTIPAGVYIVSWDATFKSLGSESTPVEFGCFLFENGNPANLLGEATVLDNHGFFYPSVSGSISVKVEAGDTFSMSCGADSNSAWKWGLVPLQVTFVRLQTRTSGQLIRSVDAPRSAVHQSTQSGR
jgi:hypothetical protein